MMWYRWFNSIYTSVCVVVVVVVVGEGGDILASLLSESMFAFTLTKGNHTIQHCCVGAGGYLHNTKQFTVRGHSYRASTNPGLTVCLQWCTYQYIHGDHKAPEQTYVTIDTCSLALKMMKSSGDRTLATCTAHCASTDNI